MEIWDLYTKERILTSKSHVRGEIIPDGYYHLVVHVWIVNSKGEFLISKRSKTRPTFPLYWECVGGSVLKGENSLEGAIRETKEEIGIDLDKTKGKIIHTKIRKNDIMDAWLFHYNGDISLSNATTDEVCECRWMSLCEIEKLMKDGQFVPTLDYFLSLEKIMTIKNS